MLAPKGCILTPMGSPREVKAVQRVNPEHEFSYVGVYTREPTKDRSVWMDLDHSSLPKDDHLWEHGEPQHHPNELVVALNGRSRLCDITPGAFPFSHVGVSSYAQVGAIYICCY